MESIVHKSWRLLQQTVLLKKFYFFPTFLSTLILSGTIFYQAVYTWAIVAHEGQKVVDTILTVFGSWWTIASAGVLVTILFLISEAIINLFEWGVIYLIDVFFKQEGSKYTFSRGIVEGLGAFIPLLEYNALFAVFQPLSFVWGFLVLYRFFEGQHMGILIPFLIIYGIVAIVINVLFIYAKIFVVLEDRKLFDSMSRSATMALQNLGLTVRVFFSVVLLYVRIILIVLAVLLLPIVLGWFASIITSNIFVSAIVIGVICLVFLFFVTYVNVVLELFIRSLWYNAYLKNKKVVDTKIEEV